MISAGETLRFTHFMAEMGQDIQIISNGSQRRQSFRKLKVDFICFLGKDFFLEQF